MAWPHDPHRRCRWPCRRAPAPAVDDVNHAVGLLVDDADELQHPARVEGNGGVQYRGRRALDGGQRGEQPAARRAEEPGLRPRVAARAGGVVEARADAPDGRAQPGRLAPKRLVLSPQRVIAARRLVLPPRRVGVARGGALPPGEAANPVGRRDRGGSGVGHAAPACGCSTERCQHSRGGSEHRAGSWLSIALFSRCLVAATLPSWPISADRRRRRTPCRLHHWGGSPLYGGAVRRGSNAVEDADRAAGGGVPRQLARGEGSSTPSPGAAMR